MKTEKLLNPNCSEAIVRYEGFTGSVDTSDGESIKAFVDEIITTCKDFERKKYIKLEDALKEPLIFYDNIGGGADIEHLAKAVEYAIKCYYNNKKPSDKNLYKEIEKCKGVPVIDGPIGC